MNNDELNWSSPLLGQLYLYIYVHEIPTCKTEFNFLTINITTEFNDFPGSLLALLLKRELL